MTQLFALGKAAILPDGSWDINQVTADGPQRRRVRTSGADGRRPALPAGDAGHGHRHQRHEPATRKRPRPSSTGSPALTSWTSTSTSCPGFFAMSSNPVTYTNPLAQEFANLKNGAKLTPRLALDRLSAGTPPLDDETWRLLQVMFTTDGHHARAGRRRAPDRPRVLVRAPEELSQDACGRGSVPPSRGHREASGARRASSMPGVTDGGHQLIPTPPPDRLPPAVHAAGARRVRVCCGCCRWCARSSCSFFDQTAPLGRSLRRPRQLRAPVHRSNHQRPLLERARQQRGVFPHPPRGRSADGAAAGGAADVRLGPRSEAATGRCCSSRPPCRSSSSASSGASSSIRSGASSAFRCWATERPRCHHLADVRLAVRRHPDDLPVQPRCWRCPATCSSPSVIDGAGRAGRQFWRIKFPLIAPQFGLIAILTYIWTFNGFDLVFALNGASPGPNYSTDILGTLFYRTFFGSSGHLAGPRPRRHRRDASSSPSSWS